MPLGPGRLAAIAHLVQTGLLPVPTTLGTVIKPAIGQTAAAPAAKIVREGGGANRGLPVGSIVLQRGGHEGDPGTRSHVRSHPPTAVFHYNMQGPQGRPFSEFLDDEPLLRLSRVCGNVSTEVCDRSCALRSQLLVS